MSYLERAYRKFYGSATEPPLDAMAFAVREKFSVRELGETEALGVLCEIVNHVQFVSRETTVRMVGWAEGLIPEIIGINPDHEIHMAEVEYFARMLDEGKTADEIGGMYMSNKPAKV